MREMKVPLEIVSWGVLALISTLIVRTYGGCEFKNEWVGKWFISSVQNFLTINSTWIETKGRCIENSNDKYMIEDTSLERKGSEGEINLKKKGLNQEKSRHKCEGKKDTNPFVTGEQLPPSVPPNTPSPSGWRNFSATDLFENKSDDFLNESSLLESDISSQVTTKALASESENTSKIETSTETLPKLKKSSKSAITKENNTANTLNWSEHLNYLKATKSGHTGLRSVGSASFIKSFWGHRNPKTVHHCFMSDITDVRQMEHALLQLLEDFHSGKLRAFAKDCSMEQMQGIREQQERLARLHFDLGTQQDHFAPLSEEGLRANQENMQKLMGSLEQLSLSIEKLQLFSKDVTQ